MIPLSTTTVTVLRTPAPDLYAEPYSGTGSTGHTQIAVGVRAVIGRPAGRDDVVGGEQAVSDLQLITDPCDLEYSDLIRDDASDITYRVTWVFAYPDFVEARLQRVQGEV